MLEVTEHRPMNDEYANARISKLSPVTLNILPLLETITIHFA